MANDLAFDFEELDDSLPRPPLAAQRFLRSQGVKPTLKLWRELPIDVRRAFAAEGSRSHPSPEIAKALMRQLPLRNVELVADRDMEEEAPHPSLLKALGTQQDWVDDVWRTLEPLERFVLNHLRLNQRVLWRALAEIEGRHGREPGRRPESQVQLARSEVVIAATGEVRDDLMSLLAREALLDGRALYMARASGLRAGRQTPDLYDLHAERETGIIELDWAVLEREGRILWQGHASDSTGAFFPAASLTAVTIAAVALVDMIKEFDPETRVRAARLSFEAWRVGKYEVEEATMMMNRSTTDRLRQLVAAQQRKTKES